MEKEKNGNLIRSGEAMFGLVNSECLPDRMSGERLNTFANSATVSLRPVIFYSLLSLYLFGTIKTDICKIIICFCSFTIIENGTYHF